MSVARARWDSNARNRVEIGWGGELTNKDVGKKRRRQKRNSGTALGGAFRGISHEDLMDGMKSERVVAA